MFEGVEKGDSMTQQLERKDAQKCAKMRKACIWRYRRSGLSR